MISFKELKRNLKKDVSNLPTIKVSLLGDSATQFLATGIKGMGIERGYNTDLFEAEYNQVERQVFDRQVTSISMRRNTPLCSNRLTNCWRSIR